MVERAELEENYSKAMERISTSLAVYSDRGYNFYMKFF